MFGVFRFYNYQIVTFVKLAVRLSGPHPLAKLCGQSFASFFEAITRNCSEAKRWRCLLATKKHRNLKTHGSPVGPTILISARLYCLWLAKPCFQIDSE